MNKRSFMPNNSYLSKQLNRIMLVLIILLIVLISKIINNNTTNNVIKIIERNIYYDFSFKEDGIKAKDYLLKVLDKSKDTIDKLDIDINKK